MIKRTILSPERPSSARTVQSFGPLPQTHHLTFPLDAPFRVISLPPSPQAHLTFCTCTSTPIPPLPKDASFIFWRSSFPWNSNILSPKSPLPLMPSPSSSFLFPFLISLYPAQSCSTMFSPRPKLPCVYGVFHCPVLLMKTIISFPGIYIYQFLTNFCPALLRSNTRFERRANFTG